MKIDKSFQFTNPLGFVVLEGVNGAGKSTLLRHLISHATDKDLPVVQTREPGGTKLGASIRSLVLETSEHPPHYLSELFLFAADRAEHVSNLIRPECKKGSLVVSDRYYYSTAAFQGYGRKIDLSVVNQINELAIQSTKPDLVILLDLDPESGLRRKQAGNDEEEDKFEQEELDFHHRLRNGFLELAHLCTEPFLVVDASRGIDEVAHEVTPVFDALIEAWKRRRK